MSMDAKTGLNPRDEYTAKKNDLIAIFEPNKKLPHLDFREFNFIDGLFEGPSRQMVSVDRIVVSSGLQNWGNVEAFEDYRLEEFWRTYQSIKNFGFDMKSTDLPKIIDRGGVYEVTEGQRRIMTAKILGLKEIPSEVSVCQPTLMYLPDENIYEEMFKRKEAGLWSGTISFTLDEAGRYSKGRAHIYDYEGMWVLTQNMEKVKSVYQNVGANGKVKELI